MVILVSWISSTGPKIECVPATWPSLLYPSCLEMISSHKLSSTWLLRSLWRTKYPSIGCFETKLIRFFPIFHLNISWNKGFHWRIYLRWHSGPSKYFFTKHKISFYSFPCSVLCMKCRAWCEKASVLMFWGTVSVSFTVHMFKPVSTESHGPSDQQLVAPKRNGVPEKEREEEDKPKKKAGFRTWIKYLCKCLMRREMHSTCLLELEDTHTVCFGEKHQLFVYKKTP